MATYLLTWNPKHFQWHTLHECIDQIERTGCCILRWSTGVTRKIQPTDRVFLVKLGTHPRGLIASGWVASPVFESSHWNDATRKALYVTVNFDTLLDPEREPLLIIDQSNNGVYESVNWAPQASGTRIPDPAAEQLELDWAKFLNRPDPVRQITYADEVGAERTYIEGSSKTVKVNVYERSAEARAVCIRKYGARCSVCGFDFGLQFGTLGSGFIHVHHVRPLSTIRNGYTLNPVEDLRPVCPNCHAMLHQKRPEPFTIEELKTILEQTRGKAHQDPKTGNPLSDRQIPK